MIEHALGALGIAPTWTSSTKDMVGRALGWSRLWFTLGFSIVDEIYYPQQQIWGLGVRAYPRPSSTCRHGCAHDETTSGGSATSTSSAVPKPLNRLLRQAP